MRALRAAMAIKRYAHADEIASLVAFLASRDAALDAARDAGNEFLFPETGDRHQAKQLLVTGANDPDVAVRAEQRHVDKGAKSLDAHEAYFQALPDHPSGAEIVGGAAQQGGEALGVPLAIAFKAFDL